MGNIRFAQLADLPELVDIYNQAIISRNATADTAPFTVEKRWAWFNAHTTVSYPIYVIDNGMGKVIGYLSVSPLRDRAAYNRTAEISYYIDYAYHRQGIGSALMEYALQDAGRISKKVFIAIILEWNIASRHLLRKFGFEKWGYLPEVAIFDEKTCGQVIFGRRI